MLFLFSSVYGSFFRKTFGISFFKLFDIAFKNFIKINIKSDCRFRKVPCNVAEFLYKGFPVELMTVVKVFFHNVAGFAAFAAKPHYGIC